jgi:predicted acyl esterase
MKRGVRGLARPAAWSVCALALIVAPAPAQAKRAKASFHAHGSVEQVYVTDAKKGKAYDLVDRGGDVVDTRRASKLGGIVFRKVEPGGGYRVRRGSKQSEGLTVMSTRSRPPDAKVYDQEIPQNGYGYLTTRDGTKLAINVHLPPGVPPGTKVPTLIEYSGYGYADPAGFGGTPGGLGAAGGESSIAIVGQLLGFAVVDVNMRGTGCSGGSFDFFEPLQGLDGYDVIETVARQPWVMHDKVGMMGISYGGISQLFVAETRPPSLSAIAPLSLIDQVQTTLYPGGSLNTGFALAWAKDRADAAKPASAEHGQHWAYEQIQNGDEVCKKNQELHPEAPNLLDKVKRNDTYKPRVADPLSPITFVHKINVPTFVACQWEDEQTGGHCPTLASRFTGTDKKWFTFTNGVHADSLDPSTAQKWIDFLDLYVAQQKPAPRPIVIAGGPALYTALFSTPGVTIPPDPIQVEPTYDSAKAAFEALPQVRVLYENGAGGNQPGDPVEAFERSYPSLPVPGAKALKLFLGPNGTLTSSKSNHRAGKGAAVDADSFKWNDDARPPTDFPLDGDTGGSTAGSLWSGSADYQWSQNPDGTALSYLSQPLTQDATVLGAGRLDTWIRSSAPDADLQVTVTEVRPDGKEYFVQSGWVRGSMRKLDRKKSNRFEPVLSLRKRDIEPLPSDHFTKLTVPLYYQGHVYRAGSQIRVIVSAIGGDQPIWAFAKAVPRHGKPTIDLAHTADMPSSLLLPTVDAGVAAPTGLPPCPGLRGEPCREYVPFTNASAKLR